MRRTVLVPTIVAAALRARHALLAVPLIAMLALALTLPAPVAAQEETTSGAQTTARGKDASNKQEQPVQGSGQQAEDESNQLATDPLAGQTANIAADSIGPIAVAGCEATAGETASITVANEEGDAREVFTDDEDTTFEFGQQGITIISEGDGTEFLGNLNGATGDDGKVVGSEGIVCDDSGGQRAADANAAADDENTARTENLEDLSCEELLVLFRSESSSGQQYEDSAVFADSEVRAQVEVCLEEEIVEGTAADENLPDTGGLSLLALAVLGVVSAAAGLSVIRGGRR